MEAQLKIVFSRTGFEYINFVNTNILFKEEQTNDIVEYCPNRCHEN